MSEHHGILYNAGSFERANYMGPGTDVIGRLERGDKGKTFMDSVAQLHDIEYMLATGGTLDEDETAAAARRADERMVSYGSRAWETDGDNWFNITQGAGLIRAKIFLEDWGILSRHRFVGENTAKYLLGANDRDIFETELLHLRRREILESGPLADLDAYQESYGYHPVYHAHLIEGLSGEPGETAFDTSSFEGEPQSLEEPADAEDFSFDISNFMDTDEPYTLDLD